jgi:hypothetical protein
MASRAADVLAKAMPENGGKGSLDYALRMMLAGDFTGRLLWQHNSDSRRAHGGWPDWVIARAVRPGMPGAAMFRELKREGEKPTRGQREWLCALEAAGFDAGVWYPHDYYDGTIARELAALAGLRIAGGESR